MVLSGLPPSPYSWNALECQQWTESSGSSEKRRKFEQGSVN